MEKLKMKFCCVDEDGATDMEIVEKVNEIVDTLNGIEANIFRHGEWITEQDEIKCSVCRTPAPTSAFSLKQWKSTYCPHCGAKMNWKNPL